MGGRSIHLHNSLINMSKYLVDFINYGHQSDVRFCVLSKQISTTQKMAKVHLKVLELPIQSCCMCGKSKEEATKMCDFDLRLLNLQRTA